MLENLPQPELYQTFYYLTIADGTATGRFQGCLVRREASINSIISAIPPTHFNTDGVSMIALPSDEFRPRSFYGTYAYNPLYFSIQADGRAVWTRHFKSQIHPFSDFSLNMQCHEVRIDNGSSPLE
ncbi:hypothetical protein [Parasulfitobacter algicola]|uniref:Uncharacterized protein n=1 Tax=Parasulfitobacter algicola TaxID=2614809 RepID=A0ABX2IYB1_9RHOB|nr:hypothetical protein [Sulfitobacter algicola]NSX55453.1 hypothetical protein [Sulfitobacter algicola]